LKIKALQRRSGNGSEKKGGNLVSLCRSWRIGTIKNPEKRPKGLGKEGESTNEIEGITRSRRGLKEHGETEERREEPVVGPRTGLRGIKKFAKGYNKWWRKEQIAFL